MTMKRKILSLVLVMVLALFCFAAVACSNKKSDDTTTPDTGNEPTKTAWPEAGVYYFDDVNYENLLTLNVGDTFSLLVKGTFHSGKYTLTDSVLVLDFNAEDKQDVTANYEGNVIAFEFEGAAMRFLKKINYTVSFNVDGGSAIDAQTVVNGKSATKPADPQRDGYVFVGWYKDAAFTTPYAFGATPVTEDTTVFARWIAEIYKELGIIETGQLVEVDRSALVAGYVGQTAEKVNEVVDKSLGGVLFIDEAYSLASRSENDFGQEAINIIAKSNILADDAVVIYEHLVETNFNCPDNFEIYDYKKYGTIAVSFIRKIDD